MFSQPFCESVTRSHARAAHIGQAGMRLPARMIAYLVCLIRLGFITFDFGLESAPDRSSSGFFVFVAIFASVFVYAYCACI